MKNLDDHDQQIDAFFKNATVEFKDSKETIWKSFIEKKIEKELPLKKKQVSLIKLPQLRYAAVGILLLGSIFFYNLMNSSAQTDEQLELASLENELLIETLFVQDENLDDFFANTLLEEITKKETYEN